MYIYYPSNQNNLYSHNKIDHEKLTILLIEYYLVQFCIYLELFLNTDLDRNQDLNSHLYIFQLRYCLSLFLYFLLWIKLHIFYQNHYFHIFYIHQRKYNKFCVQHNLIYWWNLFFFSLYFRQFMLSFDYVISTWYTNKFKFMWKECIPWTMSTLFSIFVDNLVFS